jgi:hypothetical protein
MSPDAHSVGVVSAPGMAVRPVVAHSLWALACVFAFPTAPHHSAAQQAACFGELALQPDCHRKTVYIIRLQLR